VLITGGLGSFTSRPLPAADSVHGEGLVYFVPHLDDLAGHDVVIVGPADAPSRSRAVPRVDALLERLSNLYGVPYVRTSDLDLDYLGDRLHLTEGGHREFGDAVAERIAGTTPARPAVLAH
jgi:acyl-CoA thioesterase-1